GAAAAVPFQLPDRTRLVRLPRAGTHGKAVSEPESVARKVEIVMADTGTRSWDAPGACAPRPPKSCRLATALPSERALRAYRARIWSASCRADQRCAAS